ncbi:hypothetical protein KI387_003024, partial [Taxus chinensis]
HRARISATLISMVTSLKGRRADLKYDLTDKAKILETRKELGYKKGLRNMDIDKLK